MKCDGVSDGVTGCVLDVNRICTGFVQAMSCEWGTDTLTFNVSAYLATLDCSS